MPKATSSSFLIRLALWGVALAVVYQIAPGEPAWMSSSEEGQPPKDDHAQTLTFVGGDGSTELVGRLFLPQVTKQADGGLPPVIILAHGLGLTQECSLDVFVQAFTAAGMAAFTFDYATFGHSDGWPRHQVKAFSHTADLQAAMRFVQNSLQKQVDVKRLGLWGTSYGGGHVLSVAGSLAADTPSPKAVVALVPHIKSGIESILGTIQRDPVPALTGLVKVMGALVKWTITKVISLGQSTTYIPLHGLPGSSGMMQNPGDDEGYARLIQPAAREAGWTNLASVGSLFQMLFYRPLNRVHQITAPTLLLPAQHDTLCTAAAVHEAYQIILHQQDQQSTKNKNDEETPLVSPTEPLARILEISRAGHFDVYEGKLLSLVLKETTAFFNEHL